MVIQDATVFMYVSFQDDDLVSVFGMDAATGALRRLLDVAVSGGPAPMTLSPDRRTLHVGRRSDRALTSFRVEPSNGELTEIATVHLDGEPVYVAMDRTGRYVLSAYYYQSVVGVHAVDADGGVSGSPIEWRPTAHGAHAILTDRSNRFAYVPHIANRGPNAIFQFRFDAGSGRLTPNDPPRLSPSEYLGPRALVFHPTQDVVYFSDEQGGSVSAYNIDMVRGTLAPLQRVSTLPAGYGEPNTCSQIQMTSDGRFLYAPNRGHNSVASFAVDPSDGRLTLTGRVATEPVPRAFNVDPDGRFVYVGGLDSGRIATYQVQPSDGSLVPLETYEGGGRPMWVLLTRLD